jgi:hypothetical protein
MTDKITSTIVVVDGHALLQVWCSGLKPSPLPFVWQSPTPAPPVEHYRGSDCIAWVGGQTIPESMDF